jgi:hypothetical protein
MKTLSTAVEAAQVGLGVSQQDAEHLLHIDTTVARLTPSVGSLLQTLMLQVSGTFLVAKGSTGMRCCLP